MSFHSYRVVFCAPIPMGPRTPDFGSYSVVFCAPIPTGPRTPDFGSYSMCYTFKLHGEGIRGSQALSITLQG